MLPETIKHPKAFGESKPAGFDGVFDWGTIFQGCWGDTTIQPTDLDMKVERHGQFFVCETKHPGVEIPDGQAEALMQLWKKGDFLIFLIWGKDKNTLTSGKVWLPLNWYPNHPAHPIEHLTIEKCQIVARWWFEKANKIANLNRPTKQQLLKWKS